MNKVQKSGLAIGGFCAISAVAAGLYAVSNGGAPQAPGAFGGFSVDWFKTILGLLGVGGTASLPALMPKIIAGVKYILALLKIGEGTSIDEGLLGGAEIATYAALVAKATDPDVKAGLVSAGRAACDKMRDELFPVASVTASIKTVEAKVVS